MRPRINALVLCLFITVATLAAVVAFRSDSGGVDARQWLGAQRKQDLEEPFANLSVEEMARIFAAEGEKGPEGHWLPRHGRRCKALSRWPMGLGCVSGSLESASLGCPTARPSTLI